MSDDRGSMPLWFLGLALAVLFLGAVSFELWRLLGDRQTLTSEADTVAIAAASEIDLELYRATGEVRLDADLARNRAQAIISAMPGNDSLFMRQVTVAANGEWVEVRLGRRVPYGLIRLLALSGDSFDITATAVAYPASG
jgi:hypothetical protein